MDLTTEPGRELERRLRLGQGAFMEASTSTSSPGSSTRHRSSTPPSPTRPRLRVRPVSARRPRPLRLPRPARRGFSSQPLPRPTTHPSGPFRLTELSRFAHRILAHAAARSGPSPLLSAAPSRHRLPRSTSTPAAKGPLNSSYPSIVPWHFVDNMLSFGWRYAWSSGLVGTERGQRRARRSATAGAVLGRRTPRARDVLDCAIRRDIPASKGDPS